MKILVVGDSCTDEYLYGACDRMAPEAPVPVFVLLERVTTGGMAKNVYENVISLGAECDLITNQSQIV